MSDEQQQQPPQEEAQPQQQQEQQEQPASEQQQQSEQAPSSSPPQASSQDGAAAFDRRAAEQATAVPGDDGTLIIPSKLFVGALGPHCTDEALGDFFRPYGEIIESRIQRDKFTGESRKFGFVVFRDTAGAQAAVAAHKDAGALVMDGKRINVRFAEAQSQAGAPRGGRFGGGGGDRDYPPRDQFRGQDGRERDSERAQRDQAQRGGGNGFAGSAQKLFVGRLDPAITDADLNTYFSRFGPVSEVVIMRQKGTAASRGFAFLHFAEARGVDDCMAQREHVVNGCAISIERSKPPREDSRRDDRYGGGGGGGGYIPRDERRDGGRDDRYSSRDSRDPRDSRDSRDGYGGGFGAPAPAPYSQYGAPPDPYAYYQAAAQYAYSGGGGGGSGGGYGAPYGAPAAPPSSSRRDDRGPPRRDDYPSSSSSAPYGGPPQHGSYPPAAPAAYSQHPGASYPPQGGYSAPPPQAQRGYDDRFSAPSAYGAPASGGYAPAAPAPGGYPPQSYGGYQQPQPYR